MLRIAFKILLAFALLLQGSVGAFAAKPHCHYGMAQDGTHMPCCPDRDDMACAAACCGAMIVPAAPILVRVPHAAIEIRDAAPAVRSGIPIPPTPPPIA